MRSEINLSVRHQVIFELLSIGEEPCMAAGKRACGTTESLLASYYEYVIIFGYQVYITEPINEPNK